MAVGCPAREKKIVSSLKISDRPADEHYNSIDFWPTFESHVAGVTIELLVSYSDLGSGFWAPQFRLAANALKQKMKELLKNRTVWEMDALTFTKREKRKLKK